MRGNFRNELSFAEFAETSSTAATSTTLSAWREHLGDERICVLVFESMRDDPKAAVQGLCSWLGIDPFPYEGYDFAPQNRTFLALGALPP